MKLSLKTLSVFLIACFVNLRSTAQDISFNWEKVVGGSYYAKGQSIQSDAAGNIYAAGMYTDTFNIDGTILYSNGNSGAYIAKLTNSGSLLWIKNFKSSSQIQIASLAVDNMGGVVAAINYRNKLTTDDTVIYTNNADTLLSYNMCLARYDVSGQPDWIKNTSGRMGNYGTRLAFDNANNLYVAGASTNVQYFDTSIVIHTLDSAFITMPGPPGSGYWHKYHTEYGYIARYNIQGEKQWIRSIDGLLTIMDVATDNINGILLCGYFGTTLHFGTNILNPIGTETIFLAKYLNDGSFSWAKTAGGSANNNKAYTVCTDSLSNIYIGGTMCGNNISFGNTVIPFACMDAYVAKYSALGTCQWMRSFGIPMDMSTYYHDQSVSALTIDHSNRLIVTGSFLIQWDTLLFGPGQYLFSNGGEDGYVMRMGTNGTIIDYGRYTNVGWIAMNDVCVDQQDNIFITGLNNLNYTSSIDPAWAFMAKIYGQDVISIREQYAMQNNLQVYPNPSNDLIHVKTGSADCKMKLIDSKGTVITEDVQLPGSFEIRTNEFSKGLYILEVSTEKGISRYKVLIQ
jgi:hypothetical protein